MSQIRQHCERRAAGSVIAYCSGSRLETDDLAYYLAQQGIVYDFPTGDTPQPY
jgi:hypothetical protein